MEDPRPHPTVQCSPVPGERGASGGGGQGPGKERYGKWGPAARLLKANTRETSVKPQAAPEAAAATGAGPGTVGRVEGSGQRPSRQLSSPASPAQAPQHTRPALRGCSAPSSARSGKRTSAPGGAGPFKPCEHLFESWGVRLAVWAVVLLSVLCNGLVLLSLSAAGPGPLPPVKFVVGAIAGANTLTGLSCGLLASVDALTFGRFAEYGARWESGPGCRATGFLAVLGSEASVLLLTLAAVHCSVAVACVRARGKAPAPGSLRAGALGCLVLAGLAAALPLASVGEYGASPLCLPYAPPDSRPAALGFAVALVMLNAICFLAVAAAYVRLSCDLPRAELEAVWDCAAVRHVACLTFADGLLYCPVAFLSLASALGLFPVTPEAVKSVLLLVLPLPACLNPLLYLLFSPHFREDLRRLRPCPGAPGPLALAAAGQLEPSSCDSTQALVAFSDVELILEASEAGRPPGLETYGFTSVTLAPCQQPGGSRPEGSHFAEPEGTRFGNRPPAVDGGQPRGAEGSVPAGGVRAGAGGFQASGSASASASHL
ncbi:hypothetical protein J1605_013489 [Eschrichtius robustus]|uniref:Leucine-rich repeat-containing G-protein coupled receptor 6 n=1 Tax=Eschrichtius robustus TaxID=9764 RepID=A0AB34GI35_ESCRO|nr:hypothetical protein J1605_013489 [Eschrichtius robustus]